ncbi:MAG: NADH-quinone oxidoreductase subunit NuoD [candidate division Zixibacteria bacterium CG_4_9_14_3_um_filter_46_8]|nr:MAG: NADH-quinone oxidoreductase subunit NuoD [candidate division Zixibacteria bacterium CG_4_9_14_3_um_filter_46_8]
MAIEQLKTEEFMVNMGPQHPSTHGVCKLVIKMDGEQIKSIQPHVGFLHRSIEKIAENRTYAQFVPYTDRIDYCASMNANHAYVTAVEKMAGIQVPERAEYLRVMMAELNRIASHLVWIATFAIDLGAVTPFLYAFRERELILDLFEMTCGQRLTYNYMCIGGVNWDIPQGFEPKLREFLKIFPQKVNEYEYLLTNNPIFLYRTKGIGVLDMDTAFAYSVSGPSIRGSGLKWDIRKAEPYSIYNKFDFDVPVGHTGDVWDRYKVRLNEMRESTKIVQQAIEGLPGGDTKVKVPMTWKPPEGEVFSRIEAPRGEMAYHIISDGTPKPYRIKIRTASYCNLQVLPVIAVNHLIADLVAIFGSLDVILPEVDR